MQILTEDGPEPKRFFARVRGAARRVLMLDYDGTLAPFRVEREQAVPYPGVRERLSRLLAGGQTRVVLVSGRKAHEVAALAALQPAAEVWGTHGWERLGSDGAYALAPLPSAARRGLAAAGAAVPDRWRERLEAKPASLAFHLRGLPPPEAEAWRAQIAGAWEGIAAEAGLELHPFDGGLELRVPGRSKATAVLQLLEESGRNVAAAYLGDDLTDEDAFRAIAGHGLGVLVREALRETAAAWWLQPPQELLSFLDDWMHACPEAT